MIHLFRFSNELMMYALSLLMLSFSITTGISSTAFACGCFSSYAENPHDYFKRLSIEDLRNRVDRGDNWARVEYARRLGNGIDVKINFLEAMTLLDRVILESPKIYHRNQGWVTPEVHSAALNLKDELIMNSYHRLNGSKINKPKPNEGYIL